MTSIVKDDFNTKLGTVCIWIESNFSGKVTGDNNYIETLGHQIYLQPFEVRDEWLADNMKIETSRGWRCYIEKVNDTTENLVIYCRLKNPSKDTTFGGDTGQYLDAIEMENKTEQLHIGTEDGESMQSRAEMSDGMPYRFKEKLSNTYSFTKCIDYGFRTDVPHLNPGEKIYFHFIVATNSIKSSIEYPIERDISTWFAVDQHKRFLDKALED